MNRNIVFSAIFFAFGGMIIMTPFMATNLLGQDRSILLDKIAAVVDNQIITLTDIDKAIQFYPIFRKVNELDQQFYSNVLEDLINYKVVYLEYKNNYDINDSDYVQIQTDAIDKMGSLNKFILRLKSFNMELPDFKAFVVEKVVYEKVLEEHLQVSLAISFKEIETFYREEYVPQQDQLGLAPRTLIEMASLIENHLSKINTRKKLSHWLKELRSSYRIENKILQEKKNTATRDKKK